MPYLSGNEPHLGLLAAHPLDKRGTVGSQQNALAAVTLHHLAQRCQCAHRQTLLLSPWQRGVGVELRLVAKQIHKPQVHSHILLTKTLLAIVDVLLQICRGAEQLAIQFAPIILCAAASIDIRQRIVAIIEMRLTATALQQSARIAPLAIHHHRTRVPSAIAPAIRAEPPIVDVWFEIPLKHKGRSETNAEIAPKHLGGSIYRHGTLQAVEHATMRHTPIGAKHHRARPASVRAPTRSTVPRRLFPAATHRIRPNKHTRLTHHHVLQIRNNIL